MNPPEKTPNPTSRDVTVLCTEYDAHNRPIVITYLPVGVKTIPEQQKDPRTVRVEYERIQTQERTFDYDADGNIIQP